MSLVTRCPACSTLFKVVPDQIRIAAGWVRCGQCGEVFDASAQLLPRGTAASAPPAPTLPDPRQASASPVAAEPAAPPPPDELAKDATNARVAAPAPDTAPTPPETSTPAPAPETVPTPPEIATPAPEPAPTMSRIAPPEPEIAAPALEPAPTISKTAPPEPEIADPATEGEPPEPFSPSLRTELAEIVARREQGPASAPPAPPSGPVALPSYLKIKARPKAASPAPPSDAREPDAGPKSPSPASEPGSDDMIVIGTDPDEPPAPPSGDEPEATQPSFVTAARRRAFWSARPVRALLWLGLVLLLAGLLVQWSLAQRDWLAARMPALAPALNALCAPLGCRVQAWRQLDAIVIDNSAFNRVTGNQFRFSVGLRNTADLPVASPALELTLTDRDNQPLVRRVLTPAQLDLAPVLPAHGETSSAQTLTVTDPADPAAVVGYRLTAFYP